MADLRTAVEGLNERDPYPGRGGGPANLGWHKALENVLALIPPAPRFRELDELEWSRPSLTPDQVAEYRAAILRERT